MLVSLSMYGIQFGFFRKNSMGALKTRNHHGSSFLNSLQAAIAVRAAIEKFVSFQGSGVG